MKRICCVLFLMQMLHLSCFAQEIITKGEKSETGWDYYQTVSDYIQHQDDVITLNSIIEVNGIVLPRDTYGFIDYINTNGVKKRCPFKHMRGVIRISQKDYEDILKLDYSTKICIAICLLSPVNWKGGGSWDMVMVKGYIEVGQLKTTRSTTLSPCLHFIITSIGTNVFKIQFESWGVQTSYYSTNSSKVTSLQRKRLDWKERRIYKRAKYMDFGREIW